MGAGIGDCCTAGRPAAAQPDRGDDRGKGCRAGAAQSGEQFLEIAVGATDDELQRLAEVQLAELVGAEEPGRAVTLALPAFGRENPWQVRASAAEVSLSAVNAGIEPAQRATLEGSLRKLSRSLRRKLELTLAECNPRTAVSDSNGARGVTRDGLRWRPPGLWPPRTDLQRAVADCPDSLSTCDV